jgi:hypothetical protein
VDGLLLLFTTFLHRRLLVSFKLRSSGRAFPYIDEWNCSLLEKVVVQIQLLVALHLPSLSDHKIASNRYAYIVCEGILRNEKIETDIYN